MRNPAKDDGLMSGEEINRQRGAEAENDAVNVAGKNSNFRSFDQGEKNGYGFG